VTATEVGLIPGMDGEPMEAVYEVDRVRGIARYQGDMIFDLDRLRAFQAEAAAAASEDPDGIGSTIQPFAAASSSFRTWPRGELAYIDGSIDAFSTMCRRCDAGSCDSNGNGQWDPSSEVCTVTQADEIRAAIAEWNDRTDFVLRPATNEDVDMVTFRVVTDVCEAEVGYQGSIQFIWIRPSCSYGNVLHEIGHALGYRHEQSRDDRDAYVTVFEDQIEEDARANFRTGARPWGPYDYRSIMHYPATAFGIPDRQGVRAETIEPVFALAEGILGQRRTLSKLDVAAANALAARARGFSMADGNRALYEPNVGWLGAASSPPMDRVVAANVDGDDFVDLVGFENGNVHVARGLSGGELDESAVWRRDACAAPTSCAIADVTGDGRDDLVEYDPTTSDIVVSRSDGSAFLGGALWGVTGNLPGAKVTTGDLNGDCRDDILVYDALLANPGEGTIRVYVGYSSGTGITPPNFWAEVPGNDVIGFVAQGASEALFTVDAHGSVFSTYETAAGVQPSRQVAHRFCHGADCKLADVEGDGLKDLVAERVGGIHPLDRVEVAINDGWEFLTEQPVYHELDCRSPSGCQYVDIDGDGMADVYETNTLVAEPGAFGNETLWIRSGLVDADGVGTGPWFPACNASLPPPPNATPWEPASEIPFIDVRGTAYETFALAPNLDVYRLDGGSSWVRTAGSANPLVTTSTVAYARSNSGRIYRRDLDSYWTEVGRGSTRLVAGFSGLFNINPSYEVWQHWQGGWRRLSSGYSSHRYAVGNFMPGWDDVNQEPLLVRRRIGAAGVERFDFGTWSWEQIRGGSYYRDFVAAGGRRVYIRNDWHHIEMWTGERSGSGYRWYDVGEFGDMIAVDPADGTLFRLSADKLQIDRLEGTSGTWTRVGGPADKIWVAQGYLYASSPASGHLFRLPLN
jgi:hypothetical protein